MRGTHVHSPAQLGSCGIIPAHAGNTLRPIMIRGARRDHPRACGEHMAAGAVAIRLSRSSPRMRGTRHLVALNLQSRGIIPAHAGNTARDYVFDTVGGDHPRACGEHARVAGSQFTGAGSSPRMRGTPWQLPAYRRGKGIIPAHAGNTRFPCCGCRWWWDHPRACGEHYIETHACLIPQGSSPRMRGTPRCEIRHVV